MIRFTIRDLLWLMVVVAMGIGWRLDAQKWRRELAQERDAKTRIILDYEKEMSFGPGLRGNGPKDYDSP
jgi:hypothetical protein